MSGPWIQQFDEPEWHRLAREAPDWPQVRADLIALMSNGKTQRQLEKEYDAERLSRLIRGEEP